MPEPHAVGLTACHLAHLLMAAMADDGGCIRTAPGFAVPLRLTWHNDVLHIRIVRSHPVQTAAGGRGFQRLAYASLIVRIHALADFAADQHAGYGATDGRSGLPATLADLMAGDAAQNASQNGRAGRGVAAINRLPA